MQSFDGRTALTVAVIGRKPDIVELLLKRNPDVSKKDKVNGGIIMNALKRALIIEVTCGIQFITYELSHFC